MAKAPRAYTQPHSLELAAKSLADWAYCDSHVKVDMDALKGKLQSDFDVSGRFPSEQECELLITGGDDGEIPEELTTLFPETHAFLGAYW